MRWSPGCPVRHYWRVDPWRAATGEAKFTVTLRWSGGVLVNEAGPPAVARFTRGVGAVGGGVLLAGGLVLTCAHVVNAALGRRPESAQRPEDPVLVDFPLSRTAANSARVVAWSPLVELGEGDVAVVALDGGASHALEPLPLIVRTVPADELLKVFGFPSYRPKGVWKREVQVAGPLAGGWQQLLGGRDRGYKLQAGFSGCPIMDPAGQVVAVCTQAELDPEVDAGAAIPVLVSASLLESSDGFRLRVSNGGSVAAAGQRVAAGIVRPEVWNVPPVRNASFTGRGRDLADLADALRTRRVMALTGLGGVGKSQLAVQYAHDRASDYRVVWWVVADRRETLVADLAALAERLGLPEAQSGDQQAGGHGRTAAPRARAPLAACVRQCRRPAARACMVAADRHRAGAHATQHGARPPIRYDYRRSHQTTPPNWCSDAAARTTGRLRALWPRSWAACH